jgi:gas vesicle protein
VVLIKSPKAEGEGTMADNSSSAGSVVLAFALGAVAGAAIALLYAPASGEETRKRIADKTREGKQRLSSAVERGREAFEQIRSRAAMGEDGL